LQNLLDPVGKLPRVVAANPDAQVTDEPLAEFPEREEFPVFCVAGPPRFRPAPA
jgi:hypothetical protein